MNKEKTKMITTITLEVLLLMMVITLFAYTEKGITGFGEGMITISLFLLFLDLKFILPLVLILATVGGIYQAYKFRTDIRWDFIRLFLVPVIVGVVLGTYLLNMLESESIKPVFAILIILYSIKMLFFERMIKTKEGPKKLSATTVGFLGGVLDSLIGIGGLTMIMYLDYHNLKKAAFRATCVMSFVVLGITRTITYTYSGLITLETVAIVACLTPAVVLGSLVGMNIHHRVNENFFKKLVSVMLFAIGIVLLVR